MRQYHARFSDGAYWIAREVCLLGKLDPSDTDLPSSADNETRALASVMAWAARPDKVPAQDWAKSPSARNVNDFVILAEQYERFLDQYDLGIFKSGAWLLLLRSLQELRGTSVLD
jgi:hypothetical protein